MTIVLAPQLKFRVRLNPVRPLQQHRNVAVELCFAMYQNNVFTLVAHTLGDGA